MDELEKKITERLRAKKNREAEKAPEEIKAEIVENREALEAIEAKAPPDPEFEIRTTKPIIGGPVLIACPFCGEKKSSQGMARHIKAIHKVPGISLEDLGKIERGEIAPDALADEKGVSEIFGLSPEIDEKYFLEWGEGEEGQEDPEDDEKNPDNPGPPGSLACQKNPGNPGLKDNPEKKRRGFFDWFIDGGKATGEPKKEKKERGFWPWDF